MYLKTLLSLAFFVIFSCSSLAQKNTKLLISANYRIFSGVSWSYYPIATKVGLSVLESDFLHLTAYLDGEINGYGLSAVGAGYCLTAFQNDIPGRAHLILDVRGLSRFKKYSVVNQYQVGAVGKVGMGYSIGRMKYLEGGLTLEDGGYYGMELGYSQFVSIERRKKVPKRYRKPRHQVKCP